jgi:ABC-type spermidine/putrescine transport system permease subunit II
MSNTEIRTGVILGIGDRGARDADNIGRSLKVAFPSVSFSIISGITTAVAFNYTPTEGEQQ